MLQEAHAVRQIVNGFKLDKSHTFAVNMFDEIDKYMRIPDIYEPPEDKQFQPTVRHPHPLFWPSLAGCLDALTCTHRQQALQPITVLFMINTSAVGSFLVSSQIVNISCRDSVKPKLACMAIGNARVIEACWHYCAGELMELDDGQAGPRPVCDPLWRRGGGALERRAARTGGGGLQALLLDRVLCAVVPPRLLPGHRAQTGRGHLGRPILLPAAPLLAPQCARAPPALLSWMLKQAISHTWRAPSLSPHPICLPTLCLNQYCMCSYWHSHTRDIGCDGNLRREPL